MRIFFTTDIHGSDRCFRKFLNAGRAYGADVLILGADITGKVIVPIVEGTRGLHAASFAGEMYELSSEDEISSFERSMADQGVYTHRCAMDEARAIGEEPEALEQLFSRLMRDRLQEWINLAAERLEGSEKLCVINAGNDDPPEIDDVLRRSERAIFGEGTVLELPNGMELATCGYGNVTPWNCPRDLPEPELEAKLEAVAERVKDPAWTIFNFHVPPFDSVIDLGPRLGYDFQLKMSPGGVDMHPVGSVSCRRLIEKYQPMLALHGHLHESRGTTKIGKTTCLNPGSEYQEGVLRGALIEVDDRRKRIKNSILTAG